MTSTARRQTEIVADPNLPTIRMSREFDAPPEKVFRAFTDPDLFVQWIGPRSIGCRIDRWDARTGGHYRYAASQDGEDIASFYGSFHEVRPAERIVQTFGWEGEPDRVFLETMTLVGLDDGRTRIDTVSVVDTMEARDAMLASGMDVGVNEGYEKLDALLAAS